MQTPATKSFRFAAGRKFGVDRTLGILTGVSLITAGVEAIGHGIFIDQKTIETAAAVLAKKDNRFKAAISHLSWADYWDGNTDRVMDFPGWFSGCAVQGQQLVAAKLEFYDTFKTDQPRLFARILEMAEKTPDLFGISIEPWGYLVYVGEDGVEYSERPKDIPLKYEGMPALRVTELTYGAIVDDPAANPGGFFAKLSKKLSDSELVGFLRGMFAAEHLPAIPAKLGDRGTSTGPAAAGNGVAPSLVQSQPVTETPVNPTSPSAMKEILNSIKAEFGADKAKFSQAMSIFGETPEITFEALKAKMVQSDLSAAQAQVTTLKTELTTAQGTIATLNTELADQKKKYETLKASGAGGELPLGAPSAGASTEENPWAAGSVNLSKQAEITKADPARAEALKAAAKSAPKK